MIPEGCGHQLIFIFYFVQDKFLTVVLMSNGSKMGHC